MAWTVVNIPRLDGKVAVVTGANGGLGLETARELARGGAHVVMGVRDLAKAQKAHADVLAEIPDASLELVPLDLGSLQSIADFSAAVVASHPRLDILENNAGVMGIPRMETADGFEQQFGVNHLGHFALTAQLMPALVQSDGARVVTVTSTGRFVGRPVDPDDPHLSNDYDPWQAYGQSKLANLHFGLELDRRLRAVAAPVASLVAQPGYVNTDLQSTSAHLSGGARMSSFYATTVRWVGMSPAEGALAQLRAATDPAAQGGELYAPRWGVFGPPVRKPYMARSARPNDLAALWDVSEAETGIVFDLL